MSTSNAELFDFKDEDEDQPTASGPGWKVLVVDDDEEIHGVTRLALRGFEFKGRQLDLLHAYTGAESIELMRAHPDVAVVLMDVVMESDQAGLEAVRRIREEIGNRFVRIILRTGQPGQAPEREVITQFDINDYKEKTELTSKKLFTVIYTALGSYRDLMALEHNRHGLEKVIEASAELLEEHAIDRFAQGVLEQLTALMYLDRNCLLVKAGGLAAARSDHEQPLVLAGTGAYAEISHNTPARELDDETRRRIARALDERQTVFCNNYFVHYFRTGSGREVVFYLDAGVELSGDDRYAVELFCRNVALALDNLYLSKQLTETQRELIIMLSEAIERRSKEAGNHVRRVAEYSALLARLSGFSEDEAELLKMAAPLHDVGKIAIPDAILNKPGRHTPQETEIMRTHAAIGGEIFADQQLPVLQAARILAREHHEKWDGSGYPEGKHAERIHIYGRIVALADVFDALLNARCYKPAWPLEKVLKLVRDERGRHFDPALVDLMLDNVDAFLRIADELADSPPRRHPDAPDHPDEHD